MERRRAVRFRASPLDFVVKWYHARESGISGFNSRQSQKSRGELIIRLGQSWDKWVRFLPRLLFFPLGGLYLADLWYNEGRQKRNPKLESEMKIEDTIKEVCLAEIGGKPKDMFRFEAANVYDNRYRVNIWCNENNPHIKHSWFMRVSADGDIVYSNPEISGISL